MHAFITALVVCVMLEFVGVCVASLMAIIDKAVVRSSQLVRPGLTLSTKCIANDNLSNAYMAFLSLAV